MKKRELVIGALALTGTVAGVVTPQTALAELTCTNGTKSDQLTCTGSTSSTSFLAQSLTFSGSNGVQMGVGDTAAVLNLCGSNIAGTSAYGMSTSSTVMESKSGTGYTTGSGGCA